MPAQTPIWVDFGGHGAPIPAIPGETIAVASGTDVPAQMRSTGAATVLFDLNFNNRVGTSTNPADPSLIDARAQSLFNYAVSVTGCQTPMIAESELAGAQTPTPWTANNAQYRANVLQFLTDLSSLGATPLLSIANPPYTDGDAGYWWQQVSKVAILLRQVYFTSPNAVALYKLGPVAASRAMRESLRGLVDHLTQIGIPSGRVALEMQLTTSPGLGQRAGLEPPAAWFEIVKLEALAAKFVATQFKLEGIWSWGWASFNANATPDPDVAAAACVWLWTRDQSLCDGPSEAGAGFDASLSEGQLEVPAADRCITSAGPILRNAVKRFTALTGDPGYAASVLLEQLTLASQQTVDPNEVLSAERAVIAAGFGGNRAAYQAAVSTAKLTLGDARAIIAARLERDEVEDGFRPPAPSAATIADFLSTYAEPAGTARLDERAGAVARRRDPRLRDRDALAGGGVHAGGAGHDRHGRRPLRRHPAECGDAARARAEADGDRGRPPGARAARARCDLPQLASRAGDDAARDRLLPERRGTDRRADRSVAVRAVPSSYRAAAAAPGVAGSPAAGRCSLRPAAARLRG